VKSAMLRNLGCKVRALVEVHMIGLGGGACLGRWVVALSPYR
jgi:hypothetical protein